MQLLIINECEVVVCLEPLTEICCCRKKRFLKCTVPQNLNKLKVVAEAVIAVIVLLCAASAILILGDTNCKNELHLTPHTMSFVKKKNSLRTGLNFWTKQLYKTAWTLTIALLVKNSIDLKKWLPFAKEMFYTSRVALYFGDERNTIPDIRKKSAYKFGKNNLYSYYKWTKPHGALSLFLWLSFFFILAMAAAKVTETHIILTLFTSGLLAGTAVLFISRGANKASKLKWLFTWNNKYTHQVTNAPLDELYMRVLHVITNVGVLFAGASLILMPILILVWTFWH